MICDDDLLEHCREDDPWEAWNNLRTFCEHHPSIGVALIITEDLPENCDQAIKRWRGEPIMALVIPTSIFVTNASGYPTLSVAHQRCVLSLMDLKAQIVIRGKSRHPEGLVPYVRYIHYLNGEKRPKPSSKDQFESPYYDYLQLPLQPLMDNLESQTYVVFSSHTHSVLFYPQ